MPRVEHVPAAFLGRLLRGTARADRAPVGGHEIDLHAEAPQQVGSDVALRLRDRVVLRDDAGHRCAVIARLGEQCLGCIDVALLEDVAALLGVEGRAGREKARHPLPKRVIRSDDGAHVILLAHRHQDRAADVRVVERRVEVVHPEGADIAKRIGDVDGDVQRALERRHEVGERVLPPVDFAILEGTQGGRWVRHDDPLDPVDLHLLGPGKP
ncbi:hypothetical protein OCOJLMKI_3356 [Methylobacterium iners]|uniref:Uncharacterized protein n=1 Tax=Methylobacterium iners TaxID=418707 RepID=A0ABQ4S2U6_9HYPH|nr:hypothetical protein OCOJLMKI_3356 [Methylobacterium iners]